MNDNRFREEVDAPDLGASVWLVETTVDELLPLFEIAQEGNMPRLMIATLAASLEIDGQRVTEAELRQMGARKWGTILKLGPRALRINSIVPDNEAEEDDEKKT